MTIETEKKRETSIGLGDAKRDPQSAAPPVATARASEALTPVAFQKKLMAHGFNLPDYGADGDWGAETEAACDAWFATGADLNSPEITPPPGSGNVPSNIVPADWMPDCKMSKIIVHWTAGAYACSAVDKEHYHIIVDGDGKLWRGDKSIKANVSTSDNDGYAAHTKNCNSGSIGVSACCMANAIESPFNPGNYPLKPIQWDTLAEVVAELAAKYKIACSPTTIMQHGEVEKNLGIAQDGKWDICKLPFDSGLSTNEVGNQFRSKVSALLNAEVMQVSDELRKSTAGYTHWCPACGCAHHIAVDQPNAKGATWDFDNNLKKPTFSPSILINYNDRQGQITAVCHYHLVKGVLHYQDDCTHAYAGRQAELPSLPHGMRDKE